MALSMQSDEPRTPEPTYGTPARSSSPCTVPSSPIGPCSSGNTTTGTSVGAIARSGSIAVPAVSRAAGSAATVPEVMASATAVRCQTPSRVIPMASTMNRDGSIAATIWRAVTRDTSCSADWPPKSTTNRCRCVMLPRVVGSSARAGAYGEPAFLDRWSI